MSIQRHGITIGIERIDSDFFLTLKLSGKLSHEDYEKITPMLDSALIEVKQPHIRALIDLTELEGWEVRAAWDDFKLGVKHGTQFVKIAIYGNKNWQEMAAKIGSWFVSGDAKYFDNEAAALDWLNEDTWGILEPPPSLLILAQNIRPTISEQKILLRGSFTRNIAHFFITALGPMPICVATTYSGYALSPLTPIGKPI